ncbi:hypothetical protein HKCCE3408_09535 [Rhodobacterales bacterium HKCCE3408]|nr:hypothetical protein [Rhodobacterales bacterium HKCCE3408]
MQLTIEGAPGGSVLKTKTDSTSNAIPFAVEPEELEAAILTAFIGDSPAGPVAVERTADGVKVMTVTGQWFDIPWQTVASALV